jgi:hypothetical protein
MAKLDADLSRPHAAPPNIEKLREIVDAASGQVVIRIALTRECAAYPATAVGPLTLHNPTKVSAEWIAWDASLTSGLLDGRNVLVASPRGISHVESVGGLLRRAA